MAFCGSVFGRYLCLYRRFSMPQCWWTWRWHVPLTNQCWPLWRAAVRPRWWPHLQQHWPPINNRIQRVSTPMPSCAHNQLKMKTDAKSVWSIRLLPIRWSVVTSPTSRNPFRACKIQRQTIHRIGRKFTSEMQRSRNLIFRTNYGNDSIRLPSPTAKWNASQKNFRSSHRRNAWTFRIIMCWRLRHVHLRKWRDYKCSTFRTIIYQRCRIWIAFKQILRLIYGKQRFEIAIRSGRCRNLNLFFRFSLRSVGMRRCYANPYWNWSNVAVWISSIPTRRPVSWIKHSFGLIRRIWCRCGSWNAWNNWIRNARVYRMSGIALANQNEWDMKWVLKGLSL